MWEIRILFSLPLYLESSWLLIALTRKKIVTSAENFIGPLTLRRTTSDARLRLQNNFHLKYDHAGEKISSSEMQLSSRNNLASTEHGSIK